MSRSLEEELVTKLLYTKASPSGVQSTSIALADAYLEILETRISSLSVDVIDLWAEKLPQLDGNTVAAKMNVIKGQRHNARQKAAWDEVTAIAARFAAADIYLFAIPMWNGSVPYPLKHYIDVITQPGSLFTLDPSSGYVGLLENKKAVLAYTSGVYSPSVHSPAFGVDHHSTYMRAWLNQVGVADVEEIRFQPTLLNADPSGAFEAALANARNIAARTRAVGT